MPVTTFKPTINVPFAMQIKYIDLWPNNPQTNYGASLSLRGDVEGEDARVYPKGFMDANLDALVNAGIIAAPAHGDAFDLDPQERYSIPVLNGAVTITIAQPAGERYPKTVYKSANGKPPVQQKQSGNIGGPLPGEEMDEGYFESVTKDGVNTLTTVPALTASTTTAIPKMRQVEQQYASALTWVLDNVVPKLSKADIPVDMSGINAAIATLLITSRK